MRPTDRICLALLAAISLGVLFFGPVIAEDNYGANSSEIMTFQSANFSANASNASLSSINLAAPVRYCYKCLPSPSLVLKGKEDRTTGGTTFTYYSLTVANRDDYPANLFKPAPDLAPCGLNKNSSRTWVNIYDQNGTYIYGFCAFSKPSDMDGLWFAIAKGKVPPKGVYITLEDRACNIVLKSNLVPIQQVVLFENANYGGKMKAFSGDASWVGDDFNDIASSLQVPAGYCVIAYQDPCYGGKSKKFCQDTNWVGSDFNDIISSLRIVPN